MPPPDDVQSLAAEVDALATMLRRSQRGTQRLTLATVALLVVNLALLVVQLVR